MISELARRGLAPRVPRKVDRQPAEAMLQLERMISLEGHEFWSDSFSLTEPGRIERSRLHGHERVTDAYLLALAIDRGGRLATYDRNIAALLPASHEGDVLIQMEA